MMAIPSVMIPLLKLQEPGTFPPCWTCPSDVINELDLYFICINDTPTSGQRWRPYRQGSADLIRVFCSFKKTRRIASTHARKFPKSLWGASHLQMSYCLSGCCPASQLRLLFDGTHAAPARRLLAGRSLIDQSLPS